MICEKKDCGKPATCSMFLNVPAMNCPIAEHEPLKVLVGLKLCDDCVVRMKAKDFLDLPGYKPIFEAAARGKADPDFDRAFISRCEFTDIAWIVLQKNKST